MAERVVAEINRSIASKLGLIIELVRWEDMVPGLGRPEQVILDQADIENSDVFVGILWNRFGRPTGRADSGTEEEFRIAYKAWQQGGKPHIMFYFCQRPANFQNEQEISQKSKVIQFRRRISNCGLLREFFDANDFETLLRQDITNHLFNIGWLILPEKMQPDSQISKGDIDVADLQNFRGQDGRPSIQRPDFYNTVKIPAGPFLAGRIPSKAIIDYDFNIDLIPVTNLDFVNFIEQTGFMLGRADPADKQQVRWLRLQAHDYPDHPVTNTSWYEASAYASWCGKRLPTTMEWEKAARGTDGRIFPWGNTFDPRRCNCKKSGIGETTPVLKYENGRSPYGCYDMAGNVFEWTDDWATVPRFSTAPNSEKINRGGSFNRSIEDLVCWYGESDPPSLRMRDVGFRCCLVLGQDN